MIKFLQKRVLTTGAFLHFIFTLVKLIPPIQLAYFRFVFVHASNDIVRVRSSSGFFCSATC